MTTDLYETIVRPLLFRLDPETAHAAAQRLLRHEFPLAKIVDDFADERLRVSNGAWSLASPFGLAAGLDKNGDALRGLQHLGFDFLCIGSMTRDTSAGNPTPRLVRMNDTSSLINCYGLPSSGIDAAIGNFERSASGCRRAKLIANVHADTPEDFAELAARLAPFSDGVELALRCPNLGSSLPLFPSTLLCEILAAVRERLPVTPLFLKVPPFDHALEKDNRLELISDAIAFAVSGVTIPGTYSMQDGRLSRGSGSVSGRLTFARTLDAVKAASGVSQGRLSIKASGGIHTGEEALRVIQAGASMIDVLTAFVYRGWNVAAKLKRELLAEMDKQDIPSLESACP